MSRIRPAVPTPSIDGAPSAHTLGFGWRSDKKIKVNGCWWFCPDSGNQAQTVRGMLWDETTQALLADSGDIPAGGFAGGSWNLLPFTAIFDAQPGVGYVAGVFCVGAAGFDGTAATSDVVDPTGHVTIPAHDGRFDTTGTAVFPASTWDGLHGVDINFISGLAVSVWDGTTEVAAVSVAVWDGAAERPAAVTEVTI